MSAYIVEQNVIGFIVKAGIEYGVIDPHNAVAEARMLWKENQNSIYARYGCGDDYGNIGDITKKSQLGSYVEYNPDQVILSCACYGYQSCEHDGWADSDAKKLIDAIKQEAIERGGNEEASIVTDRRLKWGAPQPFDIEWVEIPRGQPVVASI